MNRISRFQTFFLTLSFMFLSAAPLSAQTHHTHQHSFSEAEKWAQEFDDPKRDEWQKPHQVILALALKPDAIVADIGSGTGYFSVRFGHMVPEGKVYGVDTEPDMVKYLSDRAKGLGLKNVIAVKGAPDDPRLPEKVDLIIMVDTFHHIDNRDPYFRRLHDLLKPGGRIAIIDFRMDSPHGPPPSARLTPEQVKAELNRDGYAFVQEPTFLPYQYFLIFKPDEN